LGPEESVSLQLRELQHQLLHLVRSGQTDSDDAYVEQVAGSEGLEAVREIAASWNRFSMGRLCPLTCRLLDQRGELESAIAQLSATDLFSASIEDLATVFLAQCSDHQSAPVVADVARFEAAVLRLYAGLADSEIVTWEHDPDVIVGGLLAGRRIDEVPRGVYRTEVSLDHPGLYRRCDR
jgi:hypothetical protein